MRGTVGFLSIIFTMRRQAVQRRSLCIREAALPAAVWAFQLPGDSLLLDAADARTSNIHAHAVGRHPLCLARHGS